MAVCSWEDINSAKVGNVKPQFRWKKPEKSPIAVKPEIIRPSRSSAELATGIIQSACVEHSASAA